MEQHKIKSFTSSHKEQAYYTLHVVICTWNLFSAFIMALCMNSSMTFPSMITQNPFARASSLKLKNHTCYTSVCNASKNPSLHIHVYVSAYHVWHIHLCTCTCIYVQVVIDWRDLPGFYLEGGEDDCQSEWREDYPLPPPRKTLETTGPKI